MDGLDGPEGVFRELMVADIAPPKPPVLPEPEELSPEQQLTSVVAAILKAGYISHPSRSDLSTTEAVFEATALIREVKERVK